MFFASDNAGPVHPRVMEALVAANTGYAASYGADDLTARAVARIRDLFEAPEAAVYLVGTGTAANALCLAALGAPWQTVFCARHAHIEEDECGAPEFYSGGAKLTLIDGPSGKIDAAQLAEVVARTAGHGVHSVQAGPVSLTQVTEYGTIYALDELRAISDIAHAHGLPVHMDGARFANALVALGCTPAEMSWKSGIDAVSFGGTKNGLMGVEAVIFFDPAKAREFELRRKRGAQLFSKHRYLAAQMVAYLQDDLWLDMAAQANTACANLAEGLLATGQVSLRDPQAANLIFARWPRHLHQRLRAAGARYNLAEGSLDGADPNEPLLARLVCDWSASEDATGAFLGHF